MNLHIFWGDLMTLTNLVETIAEELRLATKNLKLPVEYHDEKTRRLSETWRKVKVYAQYIPHDLFENDAYYPCVTVEFLELRDVLQANSIATVSLTCGVFAKEHDGWKDAFHLMETIRQRLLNKRTIAERFRLTGEIIWQTVSTQPTPFFFLYGEAQYEIFQPQENIFAQVPPDLLTVETPKVLQVDGFKRRVI